MKYITRPINIEYEIKHSKTEVKYSHRTVYYMVHIEVHFAMTIFVIS